VAVHDAPGARLAGQALVRANPAPTISMARNSSVMPPLLSMLTWRPTLAVPATCDPKAMLAGLRLMFATGGSDPAPDRAMVCGLPEALLLTRMVPVRLPASSGVNVTVKLHEAPAASDEPHVVDEAKSPAEGTIWEIESVAVPVFTKVTVCGAEVVPTSCAGKASAEGERETLGAGKGCPVPLSETASGLDAALLVIASWPDLSPDADGMNETDTVQDTPGANDDGQFDVCEKSPDAAMPGGANSRLAVPALVTVTDLDGEVVPSSCGPNASAPGENVTSGTAEEFTFSVALAAVALATDAASTCPTIVPAGTVTA